MKTMAEIIEQMEALGFSLYEAKTYCALLQKSPLNGHEASRLAGIPPSKIYETLQRLHQKGAVLVYESEPVMYAPTPYKDLLANIRADIDQTVHALEDGFAQFASVPENGLTWSLSSPPHVISAMLRTIEHAQQQLFAALWDAELPDLGDALRAAHARGVELQVAVYGAYALDVPNTYDLTLCGISEQQRLGGRRLSVIVGDRNEAVFAEWDNAGNAQAILTHNHVVTLLCVEYIKGEIMGRVLINELGEERYQQLRRERPALLAMLRPE
jgi:sugar-specific transcriptional regulator TrmB